MFSIMNGIVGCILVAWIGPTYLGFDAKDVALTLVGANIASVVAGLLTLQAEAVPAIKRFIRGGFRTWTLLAVLYHGVLLGIASPLRDPKTLAILWIPVLLSTGLTFPTVFGPIQDRIVRKRQRKARGSAA